MGTDSKALLIGILQNLLYGTLRFSLLLVAELNPVSNAFARILPPGT
jgi:hypothetical protein